MKKNAKRVAALGVIWAQVAFAGALIADEQDRPHDTGLAEPESKNTLYLGNDRPRPASGFIIPADRNDTLYLTAQTAAQEETVIRAGERRRVADLLDEFNTAANLQGLCIGASVEALLDEMEQNRNMSRNEAAIMIVDALTAGQIRALPVQAKADLIGAIDTGPMDNDRFAALRKIYTNTMEDPAFSLWDARKQLELSQAVRDDPVLRHARENWAAMTKQEQIEAMRAAAEMTIRIYGGDVGMETVPLYFVQYKDENMYGMYSPRFRTMFLNLNAPRIPESFDDTVSVTIHEALHAYHHQLTDKLADGTLDKDHPSYKYAKVMQESYTRYIKMENDYDAYISNPTERHAWEITYIGRYAGKGPALSLIRPESAVRAAEEDYERFRDRRAALKEEAVNDNQVCSPVSLKMTRTYP